MYEYRIERVFAVPTHGSKTPRVEMRVEVSTIRLPLRKNADLAESVTSLSARNALRIWIPVEAGVGVGAIREVDEGRFVVDGTPLEAIAASDLATADEEEEALDGSAVEDVVDLATVVVVEDRTRTAVEGEAVVKGLALAPV